MKRTFRPSARLISTIGEDIIKDMYAAVVELVKNSYDADAHNVIIKFKTLMDKKLFISVKDDGHGMSESVVTDKWLVPSTNDKFIRKTSPGGRIMQGRKGIGRFAAAILGEELSLSTVFESKETKLKIDWNDFNDNKYLDEVVLDVQSLRTSKSSGTIFNIVGSAEKLEQWNDEQFGYLIKELRKLLTPIDGNSTNANNDVFNIKVVFDDFPTEKYKNEIIIIEPLPLINYYDYRISGKIYPDGNCKLLYQNNNSGVEEIVTDFQYILNEQEKIAGIITVDFRIFDRDPEAIENLVSQLYTKNEEHFGKNEAKQMLNDICGVSIFRNRFRIRPYGDDGNDWLSLDKKRVQNPAQKIGANQISGIVEIQDEDISHLVEKSARDGLKENIYYNGLVSIINQLLNYAELKRYSFRQKTGKGRKNYLFSSQIGTLTDFSEMKNKVISVMKEAKLDNEKISEVNSFIDNDINNKLKVAHELEKQIAMYQGQATLGKIMDVIMHEVRKPLSWVKNQTFNLERAYARYINNNNALELERITKIINEAPNQLKIISDLFKRLDILATRKRTGQVTFSLNEVIEVAIDIYRNEVEKKKIELSFYSKNNYIFLGWREDIMAALANILENAVYWVNFNKEEKKIDIEIMDIEDEIEISIWNNGPKIIKDLLVDDSLFTPGISGKITPNGTGTGLGLSIAGEAIKRNGGSIKVVDVQIGAKFIIVLNKLKREN